TPTACRPWASGLDAVQDFLFCPVRGCPDFSEGDLMSQLADLLLSDPSRADLAFALAQAAGESPQSRRGSHRWDAILTEILANGEGRSQIESGDSCEPGVGSVSVAWWTNHVGSKHVRFCRGDTSAGWHPRPPLWHVFPTR